MADCPKLLAGSAHADADRLTFPCTQLAFWLLAATHGHAKSYSVFLGRGDVYTATPLYDVISVWPYIAHAPGQFRCRSAALAMAVRSKNAHYSLHTIQARHWAAMAAKNGGRPSGKPCVNSSAGSKRCSMPRKRNCRMLYLPRR